MDAIETEGLTVSYGRARGIVELDLSVPTTSVFGFLGPNGAGKTTTIRVLLDFLRPNSGSAQLLGLDSHDDSVEILPCITPPAPNHSGMVYRLPTT